MPLPLHFFCAVRLVAPVSFFYPCVLWLSFPCLYNASQRNASQGQLMAKKINIIKPIIAISIAKRGCSSIIFWFYFS